MSAGNEQGNLPGELSQRSNQPMCGGTAALARQEIDGEGVANRSAARHPKSAWPGTTSGHTQCVEFSYEDRMALQRAQGWLELHLPLEANEELEEIQPAVKAHPIVL